MPCGPVMRRSGCRRRSPRWPALSGQQHGVSVQIRVGLNSGEVVVRAIRSDLRVEFNAVGQTVHLAGRMEQLAVPGQIYLAEQTHRLVEGLSSPCGRSAPCR